MEVWQLFVIVFVSITMLGVALAVFDRAGREIGAKRPVGVECVGLGVPQTEELKAFLVFAFC
jgi:hypothetical protein